MATFTFNRGTDILIDLQWVDEDDNAIDLTGYTFSVFEPSALYDGQITLTPVDLANGQVEARIEWDDTYPKNAQSGTFCFRVQATTGQDDVGSEKIIIEYT